MQMTSRRMSVIDIKQNNGSNGRQIVEYCEEYET